MKSSYENENVSNYGKMVTFSRFQCHKVAKICIDTAVLSMNNLSDD